METEIAKACREHQEALESYVELLKVHTKSGIELEKARRVVNEKEDALRNVRQEVISLKQVVYGDEVISKGGNIEGV